MISSATSKYSSSQSLFNVISDSSTTSVPIIASLSLPHYQFEYANPALRARIEKSGINKITGQHLTSLLGNTGKTLSLLLDQCTKSAAPVHLKGFRLFNADVNHPIYYDISLQPLVDDQNSIASILMIGEKVNTPTAPQNPKVTPEHYKSVLQVIDEGVLLITPDGKTIMANEAYYNLNGIKQANISDMDYTLYDLDNKQVPFEQWPIWKALKGNPVYDLEYLSINNHSGKEYYGLFSAIPIKLDGSNEFNGIVVTIKDISELVKARIKLEESERLLRSIMDNSLDGIHLYDMTENKYEFISAGQETNTGFNLAELNQSLEKVRERIYHKDLKLFDQYLEKVIQDPDTKGPIEYRWKVKNGSYRWFSDNWKAIRNPQEQTVKLVGVSRDITERKKLENTLKIKSRKLKDFNELQQNLLYMTAHDLKSPISNLKMLLQLMNTGHQDINYHANFTELVSRMETVVGGLTDILRAQNDTDSKAESVLLAELIENIKSEHKKNLHEIKGTVCIDLEPDFKFRFIKPFLYSILNNLISNSIKYRSSSRNLEISVSAKKVKKQVLIEVVDNGIGMDLNKIGKNLFRPFKRFSTNANGTGLGLYIVYHIVKKNGGTINVDSAVNQGTRISCRLNEF